jgi:hypothetical protein
MSSNPITLKEFIELKSILRDLGAWGLSVKKINNESSDVELKGWGRGLYINTPSIKEMTEKIKHLELECYSINAVDDDDTHDRISIKIRKK